MICCPMQKLVFYFLKYLEGAVFRYRGSFTPAQLELKWNLQMEYKLLSGPFSQEDSKWTLVDSRYWKLS